MNNQGFFINCINSCFVFLQKLFSRFYTDFISKLIFILILSVFVLSMFVSSEILGVVALCVFGLTILNMLITKDEKFEMNLFEKFLFVWFLVVVVSLFGSTLFHLSLKGFFKTLTYMGFYLSVVQFYRKNINLILPTMFVISFCTLLQSFVGIFQNFKGVEEISTWQDTSSINPEAVLTRVYGTLKPLNPNLFGGYLIASIPAIFGCVLYFFNNKKYILSLTSLCLSGFPIVAIFLSGCRGAYVALAFMLMCFCIYVGKIIFENYSDLIKRIYTYTVSSILLFGFALSMMITSIRTRIFSIFVFRNDSSTSFRFNVYQAALQMIKDNWLFGIGVGNKNFREIYGLYMKTGFDALSTYNVFTELWVESGIFAIISFLLFLFFVCKASVLYILKNKENNYIVAVALICILSVMVHGLFDTIYFRPQVQFIFWTMVSFISAVLYSQNCKCDNE